MNIRGFLKTSLIDYPDKICSVLYTGGCNLRCKYCYNFDFACNNKNLEHFLEEDLLSFFKERKKIIDGVTITGGEPTLSKKLDVFVARLKDLSLLVKLDSNGLNPLVIKNLLKNNLLDYVAIDIKTSPEKYNELTNKEVDFNKILETLSILKESGISYELRTTCIPHFITLDDLQKIKDEVGEVERYALQQFMNNTPLLDNSWENIQPYPLETLNQFRDFILTFSKECELRI